VLYERKPPRKVDNVDTVIFLPMFTWLPPSYVPIVSTNTSWFDG
jgi:hypothetical protein